jgi:undecaprenyl-diphosphatase
MIEAHGSSFPSGHAAYASATAIALTLLFSKPGRHPVRRFAAAALVIAGMAWSRSYLQVHWLSDVLAGASLGVAVALFTFGLLQISGRGQRAPSNAANHTRRVMFRPPGSA